MRVLNRRREELALKYRERMTQFISKLNKKKGFKVKDEFVEHLKHHPYNGPVSTDNKTFRSSFRTEKDRIKANLMNNSIFESTPSPDPSKSFELRPRQREKEIGDSKIRYKPKFLIERVLDTVQNNSFIFADDNAKSVCSISPVRSNNNRNLKGDYSNSMINSKSKLRGNSSTRLDPNITPKSILPHLHNKTHFKAATTFTLAYPGNFYCPSTKNVKEALDSCKSDHEKASQRKLLNAFKNIDMVQKTNLSPAGKLLKATSHVEEPAVDVPYIAKKVLVNCNVFRKKSDELREYFAKQSLKTDKSLRAKKKNMDFQPVKKIGFRDQFDPYSTKAEKRGKSLNPAIEIDNKFEISSDSSDDKERRPVNRIVVHKNNIFAKYKPKQKLNTTQKVEPRTDNNESKFKINS